MTDRQIAAAAMDAAKPGTVDCDECGQPHEATPSHWGSYCEGVIWAVVCPVDDLTYYYTREAVVEVDPTPSAFPLDLRSPYTGHRGSCLVYVTLDEGDCDCAYSLGDEAGSASGALVAFLCWALTVAMLLFVLLAWFAPPRADATRVRVDAPVIDYCPNVAGVQSVHEVVRHVWVIKVKRGHGPHAGERTCKPRRTRGGAR